jgi:hypothetical protein
MDAPVVSEGRKDAADAHETFRRDTTEFVAALVGRGVSWEEASRLGRAIVREEHRRQAAAYPLTVTFGLVGAPRAITADVDPETGALQLLRLCDTE